MKDNFGEDKKEQLKKDEKKNRKKEMRDNLEEVKKEYLKQDDNEKAKRDNLDYNQNKTVKMIWKIGTERDAC